MISFFFAALHPNQDNRVSAVASGLVFGLILVPMLLLLFSCCTYEKEPSEWEQFSGGYPSPGGDRFVYLRKYELYRKPSGLNRFPDGGTPKYLERELALYLCSRSEGTVRKVAEVEGKAGNPPSLHASWKDGTLVYWLKSVFNRNAVPPVSWSENRGIFAVDTETWTQRRLVDFGEMPEVSPDGRSVAFLRRKAEELHDIWIVGVDGAGARLLKSIDSLKINWLEWTHEGFILVYSSMSEKKVFRLDLETGEMQVAEAEYVSNPPRMGRGEVAGYHGRIGEKQTPGGEE